jgi:hypothetical protein
MALRLGALQDALLSAHADEDKAREAAEEIANYDGRMHMIERELNLLKWMMATLISMMIGFGLGNLWLSMSILGRLPK